MRQRTIALLLALALTVSLCAVSVLADDETAADSAGQTAADAGGETEAAGETPPEAPPSPAGPDLAENVAIDPDPLGQVTFANIESRIRENNLQYLVIEQSVTTLEEFDYDKTAEDIRKAINSMARGQSFALMMGDEATFSQLSSAIRSMREQFDAIRDGELQEDNAALLRQLRNLQDQIVMAGESMYTALVSMEVQHGSLQRQLEALDRTVEELELRYRLGQVSSLQLAEAKAGRASLVSGMDTLAMNIRNYKLQLELLIGAEQTGEIALGPVPDVTDQQLAQMDLEKDLESAREASYELLAAERTLEDARDDYKDAGLQYNYNEKRYEFRSAQHTWQAAQYTYNDTCQQYELKFRTLYAQVGDCKQIWETSKVSLASKQASYAASELKYQQGTISKNALLTARDEMTAAEEAVRTAADNLFSTYNTYCWAVRHGILN